MKSACNWVLLGLVWVMASTGSRMTAGLAVVTDGEAAVAADRLPDDAAEAWAMVLKGLKPPTPPAAWNNKQPSAEEMQAFRLEMAQAAGHAAELADEFARRFPDHEKAAEARSQQRRMLTAAVSLGDASRRAALAATEPEPDAGDLQGRLKAASAAAMARHRDDGFEAVLLEFEKGVRELQKEFPGRPEIWSALLDVAQGIEAGKALEIASEVAANAEPGPVRDRASALVNRLGSLGKPLDIRFTATDGRRVDLMQMRGKVVLVDFWATWCGPCIVELPNVKAAYERLHGEGFEILGISFDQDRAALDRLVQREGLAWPQYFDGEGWGNKFGREYGIQSIPTMWLVDRKGNLRDLNARADLTGKVERLLAEPLE